MEKNIDKLKDKMINVPGSQVALDTSTNALLRTILDVMVEVHIENKSTDYQKKFEKFVNDRLEQNLDMANGYLIPMRDDD